MSFHLIQATDQRGAGEGVRLDVSCKNRTGSICRWVEWGTGRGSGEG